ncbi:expressed unknown protein [Seminavis robusta]|uniref:Uncharacterized protein n=1 Tax=Seminavis robusta TaxID=568900 RepID=A0A9N8HGS9_9STRA|nr:expressed unknown protein [Seminavis robusta]|eukprot:Sro656_g182490.1 n/a (130) ;mRNA; f:47380-47769
MTSFTKQLLSLLLLASSTHAFLVGTTPITRQVTSLNEATGGWGIGQSREISSEEYAKSDRQAFQGYEMTDRGDFMRNVKSDQDAMRKAELDELMGVAKFAGIDAKDPKERLNKFEPDFLGDEDDIDLSV